MQMKLLPLLACTKCKGELACEAAHRDASGEVVEGQLVCRGCGMSFPIVAGIPRFVPPENYAASFGFQWNRFRLEQLDSDNATSLSEQRFYSETQWDEAWMTGKWIAEIGCGAGRFLEVASRTPAQVIGVDLSNAVDAARKTLSGRSNVHFVQASAYELPFREGSLDGVYCLGVIQHTPDPRRTIEALPRLLRRGGRLAVTIYERKRWTLWNGKYLARHITRHLPNKVLLRTLQLGMPVVFPITEVLFRIPGLKKGFQFLIPVANYVDNKALDFRQRYRWALLDTFDMLAPAFDQPQRHEDVLRWLADCGIGEIARPATQGLNLVGTKISEAAATRTTDSSAVPAGRSS